MRRSLVVAVAVLGAVAATLITPIGAGAEPSIGPTAPPEAGTMEAGGTRVYTYSVTTRGTLTADPQHFALHVAQTLGDPRGWSLGGSIEFRQVAGGGDLTVWLAEASTLPSFGGPCHPSYSCRVGRNVIINETRWRTAVPHWFGDGGTLDTYRRYVVNHETGHWLGFGHTSCPGPGQVATVMQQQSKSLQGCRHNTWPVAGERSAAASRHGVALRPIGEAAVRPDWGQPGDTFLACDWNGDGRESMGLVRGNLWRITNRLTGGGTPIVFAYGDVGDRFVCGDWDGNGTETPGAVRGNQWSLRNATSAGPPHRSFRFATASQQPVVGDWNGNGTDTPGTVQGNVWRIRNKNSTGPAVAAFTFGRGTDRPVVGDWDGNGRSDPGMVRGTTWRLRRTTTSGAAHQVVTFGQSGVHPVPGRWAGLANDLPGRVKNGRWNLRRWAPYP